MIEKNFSLYPIVFFTFSLIFLLGLFGATVGSFDIASTTAQISGPWPVVSNSSGSCTFSSNGAGGTCNVLDTVELGGIWILTAFGSLLYRMGAVFYLMYQIFAVLNSFSGFPFFGWIFVMLMFVMAIESWTLLRSGHHTGHRA